MMNLWLTQIGAVIRLELKKTFFARRGLWIYLLALTPVALYTLQAVVVRGLHGVQSETGRTVLTQEQVESVHDDMTRDQIVALLGEPNSTRKVKMKTYDDDGKPITVDSEDLSYLTRRGNAIFELRDGVLRGRIFHGRFSFEQNHYAFAGAFQFFFLRLVVFFGCLGIFMNLFRGEMLDKSLHYYLLSPIRRDVLLVGKFLAGVITASVIFSVSTALQLTATLSIYDGDTLSRYFNQDHGYSQIAAYIGVTILACIGYGSVFLGAGLLVRNPIIPAIALLIWEYANPILPALLKKFSVIYYLKSLCPVQIPTDLSLPQLLRVLVTNGDPISPYLAVLGLILFALLVLWASSLKFKKLEINYTTE